MEPRILPACTLLLLLASVASPPAAADTYEDATADVRMRVLNQWTDAPGAWDGVDVTALHVEEDPSYFHFRIDLVDLSTNEGGVKHDAATYFISFAHGGKLHAAGIFRNILEDAWYANQYEVDPETGSTRWVAPLDGDGSDAEGSAWIRAPREAFLDAHGAPPVRGSAFTDLTLTAMGHGGGATCCVTIEDINRGNMVEAVDTVEAGVYEVQHGGREGQGGLRLTAERPFRASNGGAAVLRYAVEAAYEPGGDATDDNRTFALRAEGVPDGWRVHLPEPLTLAAGGRAELEVLVETPFVHQHGGSDAFDLVLEPDAPDGGAAHAHVALGVHYLEVPQPSGHHPRLWLPSVALGEFNSNLGAPLGNADGRIYLNALEDDPGDEAVAVRMAQWGAGSSEYRLYACLEPGLLMGLDMDVDGTGALELPVSADAPMQGAVSGRIVHLGPGQEMRSCYPGSWGDREATDLATLAGAATDLAAAPRSLEATLAPLPAGDRVPYTPGAQLVLELAVGAYSP